MPRPVVSGAFEHRTGRHTRDPAALGTGPCVAIEREEATAKARNVSHHRSLSFLCARCECPLRGAEFLTGNVGGARVPSLPGRPLVRTSGAWLRTGWLRTLGLCWSAVTGSSRRSSV